MRPWAGALIFVYALAVVALARTFFLFHYPSDIIGGLLVGAAIGTLATRPLGRCLENRGVVAWAEARPYLLYPALFLMTLQISTMFNSARTLLSAFADIAQAAA